MPSGVVEVEEDRSLNDGDLVRVELEEVKEKRVEFTSKRTGQQESFTNWEWFVRVLEAPSNPAAVGRRLKGETSSRITNLDASNHVSAREYYEAFLGRSVELGEAVDTDLVLGLPADAYIRKVSGKDGKLFDQLGQLLPVDDGQPPF